MSDNSPHHADYAARLNNDCHTATLDRAALERELLAQGEDFQQYIAANCPHLYAAAPLFISTSQLANMRAIISAVEQVVALPAWRDAGLPHAADITRYVPRAKGVFFGYDFHLNENGAHLIEINTNAGGALLNELLLRSQRGNALPGRPAAAENLQHIFLEMFQNEWRLERGAAPLQTVAIVDEHPQQQYMYPEFVLAQRLFLQAGITALIAAPEELQAEADGLYCQGHKVDLIYNRLTDFSLQQHPALRTAYSNNQIVLTPHPYAYALYADKKNLALLSDRDNLAALGVADSAIAVLQTGIPQTKVVHSVDAEYWRRERKHWFFKPTSGFGGRGTYRGANVTHRVFAEIMQGGYVAQRMAAPGERMICVNDAEPVLVKSDVRCFVYNGHVQLIVARLYQGQTTNFRTAGGGFALVHVVD
ncbi:MAG: hypothetical protein V4443_10310 [Pseudomonadota bacterium]